MEPKVGFKFLWKPTYKWVVIMEVLSIKNDEIRLKWNTYSGLPPNIHVHSGEVTWNMKHWNAAEKIALISHAKDSIMHPEID